VKRTGEFVLLWIGLVVSGLCTAFGFIMTQIADNPELGKETYESVSTMYDNYDQFATLMSDGGKTMVIWGIVLVVAGIVSMILLKGNKQPKISGIILILAAIVGTIFTTFAVIIPAIFYLIAGIMALVRKPVQMIDTSESIEVKDRHM